MLQHSLLAGCSRIPSESQSWLHHGRARRSLGLPVEQVVGPLQGSSTGAIVQRLKIVASGFRGCGSDDYVVRHVVDRLKVAPHLRRAALLKKAPNFVAARLGATADSIGLLGMSFCKM